MTAAQDGEEQELYVGLTATEKFGGSGACGRSLEARLEALGARQRQCRRSLDQLACEQDAFLQEMRILARSCNGTGHFGDKELFADHGAGPFLDSSDAVDDLNVESFEDKVVAQHSILSAAYLPDPDFSSCDDNSECAEEGEQGEDEEQRASRNARRLSQSSIEMIKLSTYGAAMNSLASLSLPVRRGSSLAALTHGVFPNFRAKVKKVLAFWCFEPVMAIIIFANGINIGWTIELELQNKDTSAQTVIELVILFFFLIELILQFIADGIYAFKHLWNCFDFLLLSVTGVVLLSAAWGATNNVAESMKQLLILRLLRLLRLLRAMRVLKMCRSMWKLVQGLKNCVGTMISAFVLVGMAIYLFTCFCAELVTKVYFDDAQVGALIQAEYSSMFKIAFSLFRFLSMDSTAGIYIPLVMRSPHLSIFFLFLIAVVTIALMNLITAVVVDDAIITTTMDKEMKINDVRGRIKELRPAFIELFHNLDSSGDGIVQLQEVVAAIKQGIEIPARVQEVVNPGRMLDIFDLLDHDNSGALCESEFVDGLCCVALSDVPLEVMQILHLLRSTRREVMLCKKALSAMSSVDRATLRASSRPNAKSAVMATRGAVGVRQSRQSTRASKASRATFNVQPQAPKASALGGCAKAC